MARSQLKEAEELLSRCRQLSQRLSVYTKRLTGESDALAVEIKSLQATLGQLQQAAAAPGTSAPEAHKLASVLGEARATITGMGPGGDMRRFCKTANPWLLRLLLGNKVNVVQMRKDEAIAIREEYHAFRNRAVLVMAVVPMTLFVGMRRADAVRAEDDNSLSLTPQLLTGMQCYLAWLAYFYTAMSLRECVLLVNGSHIRPWWIQHHYWSAGASLLMLALPVQSPTVYYFAENFMLWSVLQACVMFVQNRYQRRRMYTRIALGKNSALDVVSGETSGSAGQLLLLYPMLFTLQAWQLLLGVSVASQTWPAMLNKEGWLELEPTLSDLRGMRGTFILGCTFMFMAVMNFVNTVGTITDKHRYRERARHSKA